MIDIEKLRGGLEICTADGDCHNCPYFPGTSRNCFCQIGKDSLELLNYYERLAALHIDLLDNVEALLKTLEEARKDV